MPSFSTIAVRSFLGGLVWLFWCCAPAEAKEFAEGFDGPKTSWRVGYDKSRVRLLDHRRHQHIHTQQGPRSEHLQVEVARLGGSIQLEHALPPARRIEDLKLTLWLRSNRPGTQLWMRVVFPHHTDPRTGKPLETLIQGGLYTTPGKWQQLSCVALDRQIQDRIILLRKGLRQSNIDYRGLYVDRAILQTSAESGTVEMFIDDMLFGPIVTPEQQGAVVPANDARQAGDVRRFEFRLDKLRVDGRPFFLRMTAFHSEPVEVLRNTGFNSIWIPNYRDERLLGELSRYGLWAIATPPRAVDSSGKILRASHAGIVPFSEKTASILAWHYGIGVPSNARDEVISWTDQTQSADRLFQRPSMADVDGSERIFSRHISMLGVSRHVNNTGLDYIQYNNWLRQKRRLARPGSYLWTWIETEPAAVNNRWREAAGRIPIVIEPEQIRLQTYATLSAGYQGLGFWKTTPLNSDLPGAAERRLMIAQLNLEMDLLEPFLATGNPYQRVKFNVKADSETRVGQRRLDFRDTEAERREGKALLRDDIDRVRRQKRRANELEATILHSDYGALVLAGWYQQDAQFVPRKMAANNATIVVQGVPETSPAWIITPTRIRSLSGPDRPGATGGVKITLPYFDQTAAIIFTSDMNMIDEIRAKIKRIAPISARLAVDLAKAKLLRTRAVNRDLEKLGHAQFDAPHLLARAAERIQQAELELKRGGEQGFHQARIRSGNAMQLMRILQSAHWDEAVETLGDPTASPYTVCFQTLPDHWRMINRIGRSNYRGGENLLRSGDFEDTDTMIAGKWEHSQNQVENVHADAYLHPSAQQGEYSLLLTAGPQASKDPPKVVIKPPVTFKSPPMPVRAGQILHISGWVKVAVPIVGNMNGAMLYDSLLGPDAALRWHLPHKKWQRFVMVREVQRSGEFTLTMTLTGMGAVQFDDIRVIPHDLTAGRMASSDRREKTESDTKPSRFNFWNRLPGFRSRQESSQEPNDPSSAPAETLPKAGSNQPASTTPRKPSSGLLPRGVPGRK